MPLKLKYKTYHGSDEKFFVDEEKDRLFENLRGKSSVTSNLMNYIAENGGVLILFKLIESWQSASSWSPLSESVKTAIEIFKTPNQKLKPFYPDNKKTKSSKVTVVPTRSLDKKASHLDFMLSKNFEAQEGRRKLLENMKRQTEDFFIKIAQKFYAGFRTDWSSKQSKFDDFDSMHLV